MLDWRPGDFIRRFQRIAPPSDVAEALRLLMEARAQTESLLVGPITRNGILTALYGVARVVAVERQRTWPLTNWLLSLSGTADVRSRYRQIEASMLALDQVYNAVPELLLQASLNPGASRAEVSLAASMFNAFFTEVHRL